LAPTQRVRRGCLAAALLLVIGPDLPAAAQTGNFELELNAATDVPEACRLTFVATNGTGIALTATSYQVAAFDAKGVVSALLVLEFGALPQNKSRVVQFDVPNLPCLDISRLLVSGQDQCTSAAGNHDVCLATLSASSRIPEIPFGV